MIYEYLSLRRTGESILILKLFYMHVQRKMRIQGREEGFRVMCLLWIVITIIAFFYSWTKGLQLYFILALSVSSLMILFGALVYLGHIGFLAGFNTMSEKELKEYDMNKVTSFVGISFAATGLVSFFTAFFTLYLFSEPLSFAIFAVVFMAMTFFSAFYPASKKFKVHP